MNKKLLVTFCIFLIIGFLGIGLGGMVTKEAVLDNWYQSLNKAPWTPPGPVFGFAWTIITISFALFCAKVWNSLTNTSNFIILYGAQWLLNFLWNPIFFNYHQVLMALIVIISLTILIFGFLLNSNWKVGKFRLLVLPYALWLIIATSLNVYILVYN